MKKFAKSEKNISSIIFTLLIVFFLINLIVFPKRYIETTLDGISAWAFNVLPSVFPFIFFTRCLSSLGQMEKVTRPFQKFSSALFKTPPISLYAFLMAILSGYPVGSKMVADLYMQGKITKKDAFKMSSFCSTSGPMFIIGAVGIGMFQNSTVGYILFISHIFGAFLNGLLYRNMKFKNIDNIDDKQIETKESIQSKFDISEIVTTSAIAIISVGAIIAIFFIVIECLSPILNLLPETLSCFLQGIVEITKGCLSLSTLSNVKLATVLSSFVISFGGISTLLQSITMLKSVEMPIKLFALQKFTHALLSALITIILVMII